MDEGHFFNKLGEQNFFKMAGIIFPFGVPEIKGRGRGGGCNIKFGLNEDAGR